MIRNYIKIAFRSLWKNKIYSFINVTGLAIGLACVLVIVVYVQSELSYDRYNEHHEDIYRVTQHWINDGAQTHSATTQAPPAVVIRGNLADVDKVTRVYPYSAFISIDKQNKIKENSFCFVDSTFFDVFTMQPIIGNMETALDNPFSVVLTKKMANRYFGRIDVLGEELFYEDERRSYSFNVTAVIENIPQNSHFAPDFLASLNSLETMMPWYNNWHHPPMYTYIKSVSGADEEVLNQEVRDLIMSNLPDYEKGQRDYELQKLTDIHLKSDLAEEWQANSNYTYITMFSLIAVFILLIACINFMNLSTAQATRRAQEVGVRKVLGAAKFQLIKQFLGESFFNTFFSFIFAFGIAELVLTYVFNQVIDKELSLFFLLQWPNWFYVLTTLILVSVLAGLYPAFYLSAFKPIVTLKGSKSKTRGAARLRKGMVIFQFFISCLLIIGTVIVYQQVDFLRNKKLGFDKEQVITIRLVDRYAQINYRNLKNEILKESGVINVAMSSTLPGKPDFNVWEIEPEGITSDKEIVMKSLGSDEDFLKTYDIPIVEGRDFIEGNISDSIGGFILNEAAVEKFGWENDPIGKQFALYHHTNQRNKKVGQIIGVAENFHFQSLHAQIEPLVIFINKHQYYCDYLSVRLAPGNWSEAIAMLEQKWQAFHPDKPFEFAILDSELDELYHSEIKTGKIFSSFAVLSIIVSCLGLFGLSAFSAQQRTKEIGIRKVMGASIFHILKMLSKEYVILILAANLVAWPLAWHLSQKWLANFAYHINIGWGFFVITLVLAVIIALITVSYQSMKAALTNPVETLKSE
ncbi:MAG: ABC transporter permease [Bacteroidota bacterium]